jgi:hypothetical protein
MNLKEGVGFACANDEAEHKSLSDLGYEPKLEETSQEETKEAVQEVPKRTRKTKAE